MRKHATERAALAAANTCAIPSVTLRVTAPPIGEHERPGLLVAWRLTPASYGPAPNTLMQNAIRNAKPQSAAEFQAAWLGACEE